MDGSYYTYLYIRKNGFPQQVRGGWMSSLINAGEGVDIDLVRPYICGERFEVKPLTG